MIKAVTHLFSFCSIVISDLLTKLAKISGKKDYKEGKMSLRFSPLSASIELKQFSFCSTDMGSAMFN